jgi:Domain of unknown function (DUF4062)
MNKKLQIFISSTYVDLKEERQAAVEAILGAGHIPAGMELFNAGNDSQLITIQKWINESDVYMLILGGRYGSVDPVQQISYTEIEYKYALEKGMPVFAVFITDKALDEKIKKLKKLAIEDKEPKKLEEFKKLVLSKICRPFDDLKDIKIAVHETLNKFSREYNLSGWISGNDIPDYDNLLKENLELKSKLTEQTFNSPPTSKPKIGQSEYGIFSYSELKDVLRDIEITIPKHLTIEKDAVKKQDLLNLFFNNHTLFNIGVQQTFGFPIDTEQFFFSKCAPLLLTYGIVEKDKKFKIDRFHTSQLGLKFLAELSKELMSKKKSSKQNDQKANA